MRKTILVFVSLKYCHYAICIYHLKNYAVRLSDVMKIRVWSEMKNPLKNSNIAIVINILRKSIMVESLCTFYN